MIRKHDLLARALALGSGAFLLAAVLGATTLPGQGEPGKGMRKPAGPGGARAPSLEGREAKAEEPAWFFSGYADLRYVLRSNADDTDQDLYQIVALSFGETKRRRITGRISARLSEDLDGRNHPDSFLSIPDTHGRYYARVNSAYVDLRPEWAVLEVARIGRQWLPEVPEVVRMDGVRAETPPLEKTLNSRVVVFGGVPEHLSESSRSRDAILGGGLEVRPWRMSRLSAVVAHIRDVYRQEWARSASRTSQNDDLLTLELHQNLLQNQVMLWGSYSHLNGDPREIRARVAYESEDGHWGGSVGYRALRSTQTTLSTELDPYVSVLRSYEPYHEINLELRGDLTERLRVEGGASLRRLRDDQDEGPFNREFERYFVSGTYRNFVVDDSRFSLIADVFDSNGDRFWEVEGTWSIVPAERWAIDVGTGYALYQEDRFTFEERNHVRSGFVRLRYDFREDVALRGGYLVETDDEETTHRLEMGIRVRF